jgi:transcriptional regulator of nitric oxide reductase
MRPLFILAFRRWLPAVVSGAVLAAALARAQEGSFLTEATAPAAVFPTAERFERRSVAMTSGLRARVQTRLGSVTPSIWEERYVVFTAYRGERMIGRALIVEEIGKHRPITFVVGVRPDGRIEDVAVMAYREAYGGEIRSRRFLAQYEGRNATDDLRPYHGIKNVAGATLSVEAASRAVRKAQAVDAALAEGGP